jgi:hypothetical protein
MHYKPIKSNSSTLACVDLNWSISDSNEWAANQLLKYSGMLLADRTCHSQHFDASKCFIHLALRTPLQQLPCPQLLIMPKLALRHNYHILTTVPSRATCWWTTTDPTKGPEQTTFSLTMCVAITNLEMQTLTYGAPEDSCHDRSLHAQNVDHHLQIASLVHWY